MPLVVSSAFRELAPNYEVCEIFAGKHEEIRRMAAGVIAQKLGAHGVVTHERARFSTSVLRYFSSL